ncbi:3-phosphoshikimate 1-carboxyvinyltransferase [Bifidobacterium dolichotidis]|uniref:3-phosphoshikimate 1-carboxyvinyltransferase n=1 Tax=Bifidobacterium dolichotidis TaxID=2306976 RepID=A0A430FSP4_9BIFI|nr:3-phosphoshikimate 1-carboxyvinyltransferase [Bifidobacterium dolichotidis]RSX55906.1 3-phosphoshikimate 1-carboxyvinyltransferase [Bifidobacterium dolichotidis]
MTLLNQLVADATQEGEKIADPWPAPVAKHALAAEVTIPGSKSLSNRYLILAALSANPVNLVGMLRSRDTRLMLDALRELGVACIEDPFEGTTVQVNPPADGKFRGGVDVNCGLAGTVMRFVPGLALFADGPVHFDGDAQAYARPMGPILDGLTQLGASIQFEGEAGRLPFTITPPAQLPGGNGERPVITIDASGSSQFVSGLLLIGSHLPAGLELHHSGESLPSMPHIRMTMEDINQAGGHVTMPTPGTWIVEPNRLNLPNEVVVEPDLSNAAPFLGAALIAGGSVSVPNWPAHTTQPGGLLPSMLAAMGADVTLDDLPFNTIEDANALPDDYSGLLTVIAGPEIHGLGDFDMSAAGEIAPSIAALAVLANSDTALHGIGHLRGHETNRLAALVTEIMRIGGSAEELEDGIAIHAVPADQLHGEVMETYADHRMATFAAMLGLKIPGIQIKDVLTTRKTIPDFVGMWTQMLEQYQE